MKLQNGQRVSVSGYGTGSEGKGTVVSVTKSGKSCVVNVESGMYRGTKKFTLRSDGHFRCVGVKNHHFSGTLGSL